ncbi:MAG: DUF4175 family protein [Rhodothermales bacterium]
MSEKSQALITSIRARLQAIARRQQLAEMAWGGVFFLGALAAVWLLSVAIEASLWLDTAFRKALFWSIVVVAVGLAYWFMVRPLLRMAGWLRGPSEEQIAREIGRRFPEVSDRLTNLLQLAAGRTSPSPPSFIDHAVASLGRGIEPVPMEQVVSYERAKRASRFALVPVAGVVIFLLAAPGAFLGASHRLLTPGTHFDRPAPFQLLVEPGDIELMRGDSLTIRARAIGAQQPAAASIEMQNLSEDLVTTETLRADSTYRYEHRLLNVRHSFRYRLRAGEVTSAWFTAEITERPLVRSMQVGLTFPRYARIPPQRLDPNVGDIQALAGTRADLEVIVSGQELAGGYIVHSDGQRDTLSLDRTAAEGGFTLRQDETYHLSFVDARGNQNSDPIEYTVRVVQDALPSVIVTEPSTVSELNESLATQLRLRLADDFGFSRLALYYRLAESRFGAPAETFSAIQLGGLAPYELDQEIVHGWDLRRDTPIDPVPGDVIEYYVQVWDNDSVAGYKSTRSATLQLRLPSIAEQYEKLDETEDAAESDMEAMMEEARQIREQFQELRDELRTKQESDWEDQRQLDQLKEKQSSLEQQAEDLNQAFEEMVDRMEQNDLASDRTMEMYQEMQKVVEEINSPELMEALNQLQEAMQELNLQQMQESLQNFEFNEEQYQQRLERTLELFKQIRVQQDLEEAARRAEDLAEQQQEIREKTAELEDQPTDEAPDAENAESENPEDAGEKADGEPREGEEPAEGEQQDPQQGEQQDSQGEQQDQQGEQQDPQQGDPQENGEQNPSQQEQQQAGEPSTPQEQLAKQQEMSSEEMQQLEQLLEQIKERMDELKQAPTDEMQQLNEQVQEEQLPQQMQQNAEQLRQNQLNQAQQQQQQMQQQLQQMQQQLQQMQQGMEGSQIQINIAALRRALSDILTLSQEQEDLINAVRDLSPDSPALRQFSQAQVELGEGAAVVSDSLQKLAKDIPHMTREVQQQAGEALRAMTSATDAMAERMSGQAAAHQKSAMMHLNELALLLSDLLDQMMNMQSSGSGSGMSMQQMTEQLQNAAQQQQQLNQQIQQMLNQMQGNRLSQDMQERLRQMAAQQESIRSEVKSLSRNPELRGKMMGDLNKIAEQMEETIQELQRAQPGRRTLERQQQILSRMLDATRSMQERGRENKREGRIGESTPRDSPTALPASQEAESLRKALIEALESGYSADYEELIKRYFELLQQTAGEN